MPPERGSGAPRLAFLSFVLCTLASGTAAAENTWPPSLERQPRWGVGLAGYAGIAALFGPEEDFSHDFVGGSAYARLSYVRVEGFVERTDLVDDEWFAAGGLIGAFLPYRGWVDFDFGAGLASRTFKNPDARYGPGGYERSVMSLAYRLGVSDRSSEAVLGVRVGVQVVGSIDLSRPRERWRYVLGEGTETERVFEGDTPVGGVSIGLAIQLGLEVGPDGTRR